MKKIKIEDCQTEAELYEYRKQNDKIDWGVVVFWFFAVMFSIGTIYQSFKALYLLYKLIF